MVCTLFVLLNSRYLKVHSWKHAVIKRQKNGEMLKQHRRLFFRPDEVSCLVVVFLVLAALTPRRPSSAYPSAAAQQSATINMGGPLK